MRKHFGHRHRLRDAASHLNPSYLPCISGVRRDHASPAFCDILYPPRLESASIQHVDHRWYARYMDESRCARADDACVESKSSRQPQSSRTAERHAVRRRPAGNVSLSWVPSSRLHPRTVSAVTSALAGRRKDRGSDRAEGTPSDSVSQLPGHPATLPTSTTLPCVRRIPMCFLEGPTFSSFECETALHPGGQSPPGHQRLREPRSRTGRP